MTGFISPKVDERVGSGIVPLRGLRTVVEVTEADQSPTETSAGSIPKKADQGKKPIGDNSKERHNERY
ncbi:hypothetical protein [Flavitalea sp.]|nr:hypothetical protein [Flavitalea sp.]